MKYIIDSISSYFHVMFCFEHFKCETAAVGNLLFARTLM